MTIAVMIIHHDIYEFYFVSLLLTLNPNTAIQLKSVPIPICALHDIDYETDPLFSPDGIHLKGIKFRNNYISSKYIT